MFSVLLRYTDYDYPFGIFKLFLESKFEVVPVVLLLKRIAQFSLDSVNVKNLISL